MDPRPDRDAGRAADEAAGLLAQRIAARIAGAGGWIGFDAFMGMALHEPALGYYAGGSAKFGAGGDFVTAPGLTPLFGRCVATQLAQWFGDHPELPRRVVEFGAGDGHLAADILAALADAGLPLTEYAIVELSGELRARQRDTVSRRLAGRAGAGGRPLADALAWWDALPEAIEGCVIGNELLDAMPVRLFRVSAGQAHERGVALAAGADGPGAPRFAFADRPADPDLAARAESMLAAGFSRLEPDWRAALARPDLEYVSELAEQAPAWVREVGARLARGALLLIDYGFPRAEFYHPQRNGGTLMAHRRHRAHLDVLDAPGTQDITAHIDFTAIAEAGLGAGLALAGYASQARFLLNCGILEAFAREQAAAAADTISAARGAHAVQTLLSEAEMGELFKAIAFVRGIGPAAIGFERGDRRARL